MLKQCNTSRVEAKRHHFLHWEKDIARLVNKSLSLYLLKSEYKSVSGRDTYM